MLSESVKAAGKLIDKNNQDYFDLWKLLLPYSYSFKNTQFIYEKEHRYVIQIDVDDVIKENTTGKSKVKYGFYCLNNAIKPSITISFENLPIRNIIVSPMNSNDTIINGIKLFLLNYNYGEVEVTKFERVHLRRTN